MLPCNRTVYSGGQAVCLSLREKGILPETEASLLKGHHVTKAGLLGWAFCFNYLI